MWITTKPISPPEIKEFEQEFHFRLHTDFFNFLQDHNAGTPLDGSFPTTAKERKLKRLLDFQNRTSFDEAWMVNERLRKQIGEKRIIIGTDAIGNFVCLERNHRAQAIVVWNHLTGDFERCLLDIPGFLRAIS